MPQSIDYADTLHTGTHQFEKAPRVPDGSFGDAQIGSANPIAANKLKHQYAPMLAQPHGIAASNARQVVHVARSSGSFEAVEAGVLVAAAGDAVVNVDVLKNGTSVLTSAIVIDSTTAPYAEESGAINTPAYVAGDVFEVVVAVAAGTGTLPQGVYVAGVLREGSG